MMKFDLVLEIYIFLIFYFFGKFITNVIYNTWSTSGPSPNLSSTLTKANPPLSLPEPPTFLQHSPNPPLSLPQSFPQPFPNPSSLFPRCLTMICYIKNIPWEFLHQDLCILKAT